MDALTEPFDPTKDLVGLREQEEWQEEELHIFDPNFSVDDEADLDPQRVDAIVARELLQLPMEDREKVYFDVHGVAKDVDETPELIARSLEQFQSELDRIPDKGAYDLALSMDPKYVQNSEFRIRFLRTELFKVQEAAQRFIGHFDLKMELFGSELLCKDIEQDDLTQEDFDALYDGCVYDLPLRDPAGRLIIFQTGHRQVDVKAIIRNMFYLVSVHSEDEETQRKGLVFVSYLVGFQMTWEGFKERLRLNRYYGRLSRTIAIKIVGLHMCADSMLWRTMFGVTRIACGVFSRIRTREHLGTPKEIMFSLQTFGIPTHEFPILEDGSADNRRVADRWAKRRELERHKRKERENKKQQPENDDSCSKEVSGGKRVATPGCNDVLLGRGKASYTHPGNVRLRTLVMEHIEAYEETHFSTRSVVSRLVLETIQSRSGHFLKDDGLGWVEVSDDEAVKKISHCFRTFRGLRNASNKDSEDYAAKVEAKGRKKVLSGSKRDR